jgi:hypothetical protein
LQRERLSEKGEGKKLVGQRLEKEKWQKMAKNFLCSQSQIPVVREVNQILREKEIIKQTEVIVKIRCSYCKTPYNETLDRCPNCGARA